jgi:hypothetical protein
MNKTNRSIVALFVSAGLSLAFFSGCSQVTAPVTPKSPSPVASQSETPDDNGEHVDSDESTAKTEIAEVIIEYYGVMTDPDSTTEFSRAMGNPALSIPGLSDEAATVLNNIQSFEESEFAGLSNEDMTILADFFVNLDPAKDLISWSELSNYERLVLAMLDANTSLELSQESNPPVTSIDLSKITLIDSTHATAFAMPFIKTDNTWLIDGRTHFDSFNG